MDTQARWAPGLLRDIYVYSKRGACACKRELAANGVTHARRRFKDTALLGKGAFGIVHRGRCKKTKKEYAIKTTKPVSWGPNKYDDSGWDEGVFQCLMTCCCFFVLSRSSCVAP